MEKQQGFGGLAAHHPSFRERLGNAIYDLARMGGLGSIAHRMRKEGGLAADFVPGLGDVLAVEDAAIDYGRGNYGTAAAGLGLAALGLVPGVGDVAAKGVKKGIRAFHGSPHDFDRFDMSKIGTGEGAQAYGHGLYFAESEGVARSYRDALSSGRRGVDAPKFRALGGKELKHVGPDTAHDIAEGGIPAIDRRIAEIDETLSREAQNRRFFGDQQTDEMIAYFKREKDELEALKALGDTSTVHGRMYEVRINADPDDFLDWDKPLSEQPKVLKKLEGGEKHPEDWVPNPNATGSEYWASIQGSPTDRRGFLTDRGRPQNPIGIPGIKYLDQGSRTVLPDVALTAKASDLDRQIANAKKQMAALPDNMKGEYRSHIDKLTRERRAVQRKLEPSRNYVVFDENLIEIVRKYGLAGAVAAGLISQEMARQMQEQGIGNI